MPLKGCINLPSRLRALAGGSDATLPGRAVLQVMLCPLRSPTRFALDARDSPRADVNFTRGQRRLSREEHIEKPFQVGRLPHLKLLTWSEQTGPQAIADDQSASRQSQLLSIELQQSLLEEAAEMGLETLPHWRTPPLAESLQIDSFEFSKPEHELLPQEVLAVKLLSLGHS